MELYAIGVKSDTEPRKITFFSHLSLHFEPLGNRTKIFNSLDSMMSYINENDYLKALFQRRIIFCCQIGITENHLDSF